MGGNNGSWVELAGPNGQWGMKMVIRGLYVLSALTHHWNSCLLYSEQVELMLSKAGRGFQSRTDNQRSLAEVGGARDGQFQQCQEGGRAMLQRFTIGRVPLRCKEAGSGRSLADSDELAHNYLLSTHFMDVLPNSYFYSQRSPSRDAGPAPQLCSQGAHSLLDPKEGNQHTYLAVSFQASQVLAASISLLSQEFAVLMRAHLTAGYTSCSQKTKSAC